MMKLLMLAMTLGLLGSAMADDPAVVKESDNPLEGYQFAYETAEKEANRTLEDHEAKGEADPTVTGEFSYTGPDGQVIIVKYTADENGFHPEGDHLPKLEEDKKE